VTLTRPINIATPPSHRRVPFRRRFSRFRHRRTVALLAVRPPLAGGLSAPPLPLDGTYDVVEVSLAAALPGCAVSYSLVVVEARARAGATLRLVPAAAAAGGGGGDADEGLSSASALGAMALRCGACTWGSAPARRGAAAAHQPPAELLVPLEFSHQWASTAAAAQRLFSRAAHGAPRQRSRTLQMQESEHFWHQYLSLTPACFCYLLLYIGVVMLQ
jgi:hypothetical protein